MIFHCNSFLQNDLRTEDFSEMSAPLLYDMFKAKSEYPLHLAVRHHREDVVFLFLIEFNAQVFVILHLYFVALCCLEVGL